MKKSIVFFLIVVISTFSYLFYQHQYILSEGLELESEQGKLENKVLFVTVEEMNMSMKKNTFSSLEDSVRFWNLDSEKNKIYMRKENLLPSSLHKMIVIHNKGNDYYRTDENIIPISEFPYQNTDKKLDITYLGMNEKGELFLDWKGKNIHISEGDTYLDWWLDGWRFKSIKISNYGLFELKDFIVNN